MGDLVRENNRLKNELEREKHKNSMFWEDFFTALDYNGWTSFFYEILEKLKNHEASPTGLLFSYDFDPRLSENYWEFSFIWSVLILNFGDFGTSPRSGWITDEKGLIDLLEKYLSKWEEVDEWNH